MSRTVESPAALQENALLLRHVPPLCLLNSIQVNAKVAAKLMAQEADAAAEAAGPQVPDVPAAPGVTKRRGELVANPLADDRFAAMFEEDDFVVDEVRSRGGGGEGLEAGRGLRGGVQFSKGFLILEQC